MITYFQALILGLLQGITELFPISSLGHSVILPTILGWQIDQSNAAFVVFLVATHFATAVVLLGVFFKDWVLIVKGVFRSLKTRTIKNDVYAKLGWLIIVATIPAGLIGVVLQKRLAALFASALSAALFLILNGVLLSIAEYLRKKKLASDQSSNTVDSDIASMSWWQGIKIGTAQCLALIPGFSRTGSTLAGGLLVGLTHEEAVRFSFLLATPIIFAAAVLKLPHLLHAPSGTLGPTVLGALAAAIAAYGAVRFLTKYFEKHTLVSFARYCIVAGIVFAVIIIVR